MGKKPSRARSRKRDPEDRLSTSKSQSQSASLSFGDRETTATRPHDPDNRPSNRVESGPSQRQPSVEDVTGRKIVSSQPAGTASEGPYVPYDPGPSLGDLSSRYGIDVQQREARKLQQLEREFGREKIHRWVDEGMPVETMGKPRDMQAFRSRQDDGDGDHTGTHTSNTQGHETVFPSGTERVGQTDGAVSRPADPAEREAESVAEVVAASGLTTDPASEDDENHKRRGHLAFHPGVTVARAASQSTDAGNMAPGTESLVRRGVRGHGKPLPSKTRSAFEATFGADFSDVQVHTNEGAAEAAKSINAEAYTLGTDIAFANGSYQPNSRAGQKLLAHELTHVVQQRGDSSQSAHPVMRKATAREELPLIYTVQRGDTLWDIAEQFYGSGSKYPHIKRANDQVIEDPNHIEPGWELTIPRLSESTVPEPADGSESDQTPEESPEGDGAAPGDSCDPKYPLEDALAIELAAAKRTLRKSSHVSGMFIQTLGGLGGRGEFVPTVLDNKYWFAKLYELITYYEITERNKFEYPSFVMHFIPIFYDMYYDALQNYLNNEFDQVHDRWLTHFQATENPERGSLTAWKNDVQESIQTGVEAHIIGDMSEALEKTYTSYAAKYCVKDVPFSTFHDDFFTNNREIFGKVRAAFMLELSKLSPSPLSIEMTQYILGVGSDATGQGLSVDEIYDWRQNAWDKASKQLSQ